MQPVSPRLLRLLELLLQKDEPRSAGELACELGVSRRTLFRELKNAGAAVESRGMTLASIPGKGLEIRGDAAIREGFAAVLRAECPARPENRQERLLGLVITLLDDNDVHKMFYFAYTLGASEATVGKDLDELEPWLAGRGITLSRRPGLGVCVSGGEGAVRGALLYRLVHDGRMGSLPYLMALGYPPPDITAALNEIFEDALGRALDWMTPDSWDMLRLYLAVAVERIEKGNLLDEADPPSGGAYLYRLSNFIAGKIEERLSVRLPQPERCALARQLKTCRAMLHNPFNPSETRDYADILHLAHEMIDRFDPELGPSLKLNEHLLNGLGLHLWAALDRLERGMELPGPPGCEVAEKYPELFAKSLRAVTAIEEKLGVPVPESETSLIAMHFYAVLFHLEARNTRKRVLRVCILCVGGIGVSYMLASQIRQRYKDELEIDLSDYTGPLSGSYDFLISLSQPTGNFRTDKPVIVVNSFLSGEDHERIREMIDRLAFVKRTAHAAAARAPLAGRIARTTALLDGAKLLLDSFRRIDIDADCGFTDLVAAAAGAFGTGAEGACILEKALVEREAVSSQVLERLSIVLLHARSDGTERPVIALIVPEGGVFRSDYFKGARACVLMLMPREAAGMGEIFGMISGALVDDTDFLGAVHAGDAERLRPMLEGEISEYLVQFCKETLKN
ncbi:MAG: PRD domain-containing protein [Spirochaetaceae bacterium]|nr:PRD domain-containing protein [Spirochaetaceae bacterium]